MNTRRQSGLHEGKRAAGLSFLKMYKTEEELIQGCRQDDRRAQKLLVERYSRMLHMVCRRYAPPRYPAEDVLQDAYIKIFKNLDKFDSDKGSLEGWMRKVAINVALSRRRSMIKKLGLELYPERLPENSVSPSVYDQMDENELLKLINQLPDLYREVFNLAAIDGFQHDEIATMLGMAPGTSRSYLTRARKMIKKELHKLERLQDYERRAV